MILSLWIIILVSSVLGILFSNTLFPLFVDTNGVASFYVKEWQGITLFLIAFIFLTIFLKISKNNKHIKYIVLSIFIPLVILFSNAIVYSIFLTWFDQYIIFITSIVILIHYLLSHDVNHNDFIGKHLFLNRYSASDVSVFNDSIKFYKQAIPYFSVSMLAIIIIKEIQLIFLYVILISLFFIIVINIYSYYRFKKKHPFAFSRPTEFYFLRNAESEWNREQIIEGRTDINLTGNGVKKTYLLKDSLAASSINFNKVLTSPSLQAKTTAAILATTPKDVRVIKLLQNRNLGDATGQPLETWNQRVIENKVEGLESIDELLSRAKEFLNYLSSTYNKQRILIVTSDSFIKAVLMCVENKTYDDFEDISINNLRFTRIIKQETGTDKFNVVEVNKKIDKLV